MAEAVAEAVLGAVAAAGAGDGVPGVVGQPVQGAHWVGAGEECPCGRWGKSAAAGTRTAGRRHERCGRTEASWHLTKERMFLRLKFFSFDPTHHSVCLS